MPSTFWRTYVSDERLLSPRDVAEYTDLSYRTILRAIEAGDLPAFRFGGKLRVNRFEMLQWIDGKRLPAKQREERKRMAPLTECEVGSLRALANEPEASVVCGTDRPQERSRMEGSLA